MLKGFMCTVSIAFLLVRRCRQHAMVNVFPREILEQHSKDHIIGLLRVIIYCFCCCLFVLTFHPKVTCKNLYWPSCFSCSCEYGVMNKIRRFNVSLHILTSTITGLNSFFFYSFAWACAKLSLLKVLYNISLAKLYPCNLINT